MDRNNHLNLEKINLVDEHGKPLKVTSDGSIGLLALGYKGVLAWKKELKNKK